jgi:hypothetical protein
MADQQSRPNVAALRKLEASLQLDLLEQEAMTHASARNASMPTARQLLGSYYWRVHLLHWWLRLRKTAYVAGSLAGLVLMAMGLLWWRLGSGPIELDIATPWLTAAIEENFGSNHQVELGGTVIERDANGRTALRIP